MSNSLCLSGGIRKPASHRRGLSNVGGGMGGLGREVRLRRKRDGVEKRWGEVGGGVWGIRSHRLGGFREGLRPFVG